MPIGKNSIKRVKNGGYSNVKTSAPDMENSTVIANVSPEVIEKMIPSAKKTAPKKAESATAKKQTQVKKTASAKAEKAVEKVNDASTKSEKDGFIRVSLGCDLPDYLL